MVRRSLLLLALAACAAQPGQMQIVAGEAGAWALGSYPARDVALDTLTGDRVTVWVDGRIMVQIDPADAADLTPDDLVRGADAPRTSWASKGDLAVPTEFDTLGMFTAWAHVDAALGWLDTLGVDPAVTAPIDVLYDPVLEGAPLSSDNAFYVTLADVMAVGRPVLLDGIPMGMNEGVVAHELGHRVAAFEMWGGDTITVQLGIDAVAEAEAYVHAASLDEGVADYLGAVYAANPGFLDATTGFSLDRDLSVLKAVDPAWFDGIDHAMNEYGVDPYVEGAVTASALWAAGEVVGHDRGVQAAIAGLRAVSDRAIGLTYTLGDFEREVVRELGPDACPAFQQAFAPIAHTFEGCP